MKKHSASAKRRRREAPASSVNELLERMKSHPENFAFGGFMSSEDEGTGFMCSACAMPADSFYSELSECCGVPVIVSDD
jgi:hypothetical protein